MHIEIQNCFSFWGTSSPRPPTGASPLDLTGDFCPPDPCTGRPPTFCTRFTPLLVGMVHVYPFTFGFCVTGVRGSRWASQHVGWCLQDVVVQIRWWWWWWWCAFCICTRGWPSCADKPLCSTHTHTALYCTARYKWLALIGWLIGWWRCCCYGDLCEWSPLLAEIWSRRCFCVAALAGAENAGLEKWRIRIAWKDPTAFRPGPVVFTAKLFGCVIFKSCIFHRLHAAATRMTSVDQQQLIQ